MVEDDRLPALARGPERADVRDAGALEQVGGAHQAVEALVEAWLEAVVQASKPNEAIHGAISGGAAKTG